MTILYHRIEFSLLIFQKVLTNFLIAVLTVVAAVIRIIDLYYCFHQYFSVCVVEAHLQGMD